MSERLSNNNAAKPLAGQRILHVINADGGGGVEHLSKTLANHQQKLGGHVKILFLYSGSDVSKAAKIAQLLRAVRNIMGFQPNMLMTFQPTSSVIASLAARLTGCRLRLIHQSNLPRLTHALPRLLDRLAGSWGLYSVIIMNSQATKAAFQSYPARYRNRLYDIAHGVDWPHDDIDITPEQQAKRRAQKRKELGISAGATVLFSCARLSAEKSLETIIKALPDMPKTIFLLAGDGAHKQALQDLAIQLGVSNRSYFWDMLRNSICQSFTWPLICLSFPPKLKPLVWLPLRPQWQAW